LKTESSPVPVGVEPEEGAPTRNQDPTAGWKRRPGFGALRGVLGVLIVLLAAALFVREHPPLLRALVFALPIPGMLEIPDLGPTLLPPKIDAPGGSPPEGYLALSGNAQKGPFGCGFLLELPDGRRVGISAAHATQPLPSQSPAEFRSPDGGLAAALSGQLRLGETFIRDQFDMDYALWSLQPGSGGPFLKPDPRGRAQPGERIWVFGLASNGSAASIRWAGTVMTSSPSSAWLRMDDSFDPRGYSGCPAVSQYTGRLVGMAVAGEQGANTLIGLHPVGSLVEKASAALPTP
jgi:hypothetical protein